MINGLSRAVKSAFVQGLPKYASCTDNFTRDGLEKKTKREAVKYRNIQANPDSMVRALCFDIDSSNGLYQWQDNNALPPNWIAVNPDNNHAHYGYLLRAPISRTAKSKVKPQLFANAVSRGLREKLKGDRAYSAYTTKNPLNGHWRVFTAEDEPYTLDILADSVTLNWGRSSSIELDDIDEDQRHQSLFYFGRFEIYKVALKYQRNQDPEGLREYTARLFDELNHKWFGANALPVRQVDSLAKCVANWCYTKYIGDGKNRGVCDLASKAHGLTLADRQSYGAGYTNKVRKEATEAKIREAVAYLKTSGKKVNGSTIANYTGLSRAGVSKYKELIRELNR